MLDVGGLATRVYQDGHGEPLVLIHGGEFGLLYSLDSWSLNLPALAGSFRVCAFDLPGQGYTDNPQTPEGYTIEGLLAQVRRTLDALGITRAHLVGHSRGAFLATCLAVEAPELARSLTIVDSSTTAPDHPDYPLGIFYTRLAERTPPGPPTVQTVRLEPEAQSHGFRHITDDFVSRMLAIARLPKTAEAQRTLAAHSEAWLASLNAKRRAVLSGIAERGLPVPTLVVWGRDDPSAPLPVGLALYDLICQRTPRAELHVLNQAGHYAFREQPAAFNRVLGGFCRDVSEEASG